MKMYIAKETFDGVISMKKGEKKKLDEKRTITKDLEKAGLITLDVAKKENKGN